MSSFQIPNVLWELARDFHSDWRVRMSKIHQKLWANRNMPEITAFIKPSKIMTPSPLQLARFSSPHFAAFYENKSTPVAPGEESSTSRLQELPTFANVRLWSRFLGMPTLEKAFLIPLFFRVLRYRRESVSPFRKSHSTFDFRRKGRRGRGTGFLC